MSESPALATTTQANIQGSDWAIDLAQVAKTYGRKIQALKGISMRVRRGEVFGLLGPNGAGKSTLVKILMTVIKPSRCEGSMLGQPIGSRAVLRRIGYLPEHHRFPTYLTGAQVLDFYAAMTEVPRADRRKRTPELLDLVGMGDWGSTRISKYSKGMRQRVGIAQALMNNPEIVFLDEPTDGVDPVGRRDIREIVAELRRRGKTVFLNSHLLSELEMVCDRVAILVHGQVARQGTLDELTAGKERYEITLAGDEAPTRIESALPGLLRLDQPQGELAKRVGARGELAGGQWVEIDHATIRVGTTDPATIQPLIDKLREHGAVIRSIRPHRPSLEDLFLEAVGEPASEPPPNTPPNNAANNAGKFAAKNGGAA
ncbi:MAG: ABC transporter ATP-binding protein [Phycisphaerales bacterium]|nr:ABC transporter ATP-binding protein [Phycisphaerales bacterium]